MTGPEGDLWGATEAPAKGWKENRGPNPATISLTATTVVGYTPEKNTWTWV